LGRGLHDPTARRRQHPREKRPGLAAAGALLAAGIRPGTRPSTPKHRARIKGDPDMKIAIITGSTRPGRRAPLVAQWVLEVLGRQPAMLSGEVTLHSIDLATTDLPLFCEPAPPMTGMYQHAYTRDWSALIADFDGYIFITPEYNHSLPAVLKNAIDHLYGEWNDKAAGIVSYGVAGGVRAGEHLRQVLAEVKVATVRSHVALSVFEDFVAEGPMDTGEFAPRANHEAALIALGTQVLEWGGALRQLREEAGAVTSATSL